MRLIGHSHFSSSGLLKFAYVPLGGQTVIYGQNDSGKTSWLQQLISTLAPNQSDVSPAATSAMFFAECDEGELADLMRHLASDLIRQDDSVVRLLRELGGESGRPGWERHRWMPDPWDGDELDDVRLDPDRAPLLAQWIEELVQRTPADSQHDWRFLMESAASPSGPFSKLLAGFERGANLAGTESGWRVFLCLPPFDELTEAQRKALSSLYWECLEDRLGRDQGENESLPWMTTALFNHISFEEADGVADMGLHRSLRGAPIVVAPLGETQTELLPIPIVAPGRWDRLVRRAQDSVDEVLPWLSELEDWGATDRRDVPERDREPWLLSDGESFRVHPFVDAALKMASTRATFLAPSFIGDRYTIRLAANRVDEWGVDGRVRIELKSRDSADDDAFPVDAVADGLQLWLQFAVGEALVELRQASDSLLDLARDVDRGLNPEGHGLTSDDPELERWIGQDPRDAADDAIDEYLQGTWINKIEAEGEKGNLSAVLSAADSERKDLSQTLARGRIYVIDEPERHLHPSLQRSVASWLSDAVRQRGLYAVLATHSFPFVAMGGDVSHTYAVRQGNSVDLIRVPRDAIADLDLKAAEMGFDRGEFLTTTRLLLLVEGRVDQAVLEALFPNQLQEFGIRVIPMHGVGRSQGIMDIETFVRVTSASVAVWFDNVPIDFIARLEADPGFVHCALKSRVGEHRALASVYLTASRQERPITALPHPGRDIFDLLDEGSIAATFSEFPGHKAADEEWRVEMAGGRRAGERKAFFRERFEVVVDESNCREIASRMRANERIPESLRDLIDGCERTTLNQP